jgi:hypothetical protein
VEEEDDAEKKKYISKLSSRLQKATVTLGGMTKKAHELDNIEMKEALDKHDDPKDQFSLTADALMVFSTSRVFYKINGGPGKRLAYNPLQYENNTDVEGASQKERIISNLRMFLTNPGNGKKKGVCCVLVCI